MLKRGKEVVVQGEAGNEFFIIAKAKLRYGVARRNSVDSFWEC